MQLAPTPKPLHSIFLRWPANNRMAPLRKCPVKKWCHLTTHTSVVWIKMTRWSLTCTTPSPQWLQWNGGAESALILLIDLFYNSFVLEQESTHHARQSQKLFRIDLAKQLIGNFSSRKKFERPSDELLLARHVERHFPDFLSTNEKGKRLERRCKVCYDVGKVKIKDIWVIDQVWGQDGWILAKFFFCMFMNWYEVEVHKLTKKEWGQYPAILTEQTWSIKDLLFGFWGNFACGIHRVISSGQDGSILPAWVANHSVRFGSSCPLAELAI